MLGLQIISATMFDGPHDLIKKIRFSHPAKTFYHAIANDLVEQAVSLDLVRSDIARRVENFMRSDPELAPYVEARDERDRRIWVDDPHHGRIHTFTVAQLRAARDALEADLRPDDTIMVQTEPPEALYRDHEPVDTRNMRWLRAWLKSKPEPDRVREVMDDLAVQDAVTIDVPEVECMNTITRQGMMADYE